MADMKEAVATLGPYIGNFTSFILADEEEMSRPPDAPGPAKFCQLTHYYLKPKAAPAFYDAVKEIKAALDTAAYPVRNREYALVSGGEVPCWVNATDRSSWSDFAGPEGPAKSPGGETGRPQGDGAHRKSGRGLRTRNHRDRRLPAGSQLHPGEEVAADCILEISAPSLLAMGRRAWARP